MTLKQQRERRTASARLSWIFVLAISSAAILVAPVAANSNQLCNAEKELYANCVFRLDPDVGKACDSCRIATFDDLPDRNENCEETEANLCQAVHTCGCQNCQDELENFWQCTTVNTSNGTCGIECFTEKSTTPEGPLCPEHFDAYKECVLNDLDEETRGSCDDCRLQASNSIPEDVTDCGVVQDIFCKAVESCDCGSCAGPLESYLDCDVYKRWFGECEINCGLASSPVAGVATSTEAESGAWECRHFVTTASLALVLVEFLVR